ncbi:hypothetical protein BBJ28_00022145 [Nothophytophthora sp. Chile5]|nr:hypothetical protein BBJ28_00022145 [Nothophytophthora sp. Chile5]
MRLLLLLLAPLLAVVAQAERQEQPAALAPFHDIVGLSCTTRTDCGYVPALACVNGKCEYCRPAAHDCGDDAGDLANRCQVVEAENEATGELETQYGLNSEGETVAAAYCVEKDLFAPFTWKDMVTTFVAFSCTALGSGGGIGGGGLLVPMYIFFGGLNPKHAIPLSKVTIFGSAVATYVSNFNRKHPINNRRPIINYEMVGLMEPTTLLGTVFGVMMNHIFPNWLILVLLVTLLSFTTYKTLAKGKKIRQIQRENEEDFRSLPPLIEHEPSSSDPLVGSLNKRSFGTFPSDDGQWTHQRSALERRETRMFPLVYLWPLALAWLVVLVQSLLRGGHGAPSAIGVTCASGTYWLLTFLPLTILVAIGLWMGYRLRLLNRIKVLSGYHFVDGDIHWTKRRVFVFPSVCTIAGVAAGLLGIGGGMVKGPIMLEVGILPPVQSATTSFMILFTASSTTLQFAINGQFPGERQYDYMAWFALMGFLGGFCGQKVVGYFVKKYKRESIMVYILGATIGLSAVAMGFIGLRATLSDIEKGVHLGFHGICDNE